MDTSSKGVNLRYGRQWSGRACASLSGSEPDLGMRLLWEFCLHRGDGRWWTDTIRKTTAARSAA